MSEVVQEIDVEDYEKMDINEKMKFVSSLLYNYSEATSKRIPIGLYDDPMKAFLAIVVTAIGDNCMQFSRLEKEATVFALRGICSALIFSISIDSDEQGTESADN